MSNLKLKSTPQNLTEALAVLNGKQDVAIGHNTRLEVGGDDAVYATYHGNRIVRYGMDGVAVSWAGWASTTTTTRLNMLAPARFNIRQFEPCINGEAVSAYGWNTVG